MKRTKAQLEADIQAVEANLEYWQGLAERSAEEHEQTREELNLLRAEYNALLADAQPLVEEFREQYDTAAMEADVADELALLCFDEGAVATRLEKIYNRLVGMADELRGSNWWREDEQVKRRHERLNRIAERKKWELQGERYLEEQK